MKHSVRHLPTRSTIRPFQDQTITQTITPANLEPLSATLRSAAPRPVKPRPVTPLPLMPPPPPPAMRAPRPEVLGFHEKLAILAVVFVASMACGLVTQAWMRSWLSTSKTPGVPRTAPSIVFRSAHEGTSPLKITLPLVTAICTCLAACSA